MVRVGLTFFLPHDTLIRVSAYKRILVTLDNGEKDVKSK